MKVLRPSVIVWSRGVRNAGLLLALFAPIASLRTQGSYATTYSGTTFAGFTATSGSTDATGAMARFNIPSDMALDSSGIVFAAETANATIRKITPAGVVWLMSGAAIDSSSSLAILSYGWTVGHVGDFIGAGKADIFLPNGSTGERVIWTMNSTTITSGASLGVLATNWVFLAN
ncbi:MAG: hypothetical protein ABI222_08325 [Opitutaceae bacterium]